MREKMTGVQTIIVSKEEADIRLDRWFARHYPDLKNGMLQRLIRSKNIRVNHLKTSADYRLKENDAIRVPPMEIESKKNEPMRLSKADEAFMKSLVIYKDNDIIALNKPAGLAVQGGSKTVRHIDGLLDALRFEKNEKPHLVHRLDKETSGVLLLGRTATAAAKLSEIFKSRKAQKIYWAVVSGKPKLLSGKIDAPLMKAGNKQGGEQVKIDFENGRPAQTLYRVVDSLGKKASWLELSPLTGRTHQLRVHCASALNTPIIGDEKYGVSNQSSLGLKNENVMHLHARAIRIMLPRKETLMLTADLPMHMKETFDFLGFDERACADSFIYFKKEDS